MIDLQTISEEISKLEKSGNTSYPICQKLADLYIVRDHLMGKQGGNYARNRSNYEQGGNSNYGYYERGGNSGNNSSNYAMYEDYNYNRMMDEEMGKPPRMSMPMTR